jgi:hypothetical protein
MSNWAYTQEKNIFLALQSPIFSPKTAFFAKPSKNMLCWLHVKYLFDAKNELTEASRGVRIKEQYKRTFDIFSTREGTLLLLRIFNGRIGQK